MPQCLTHALVTDPHTLARSVVGITISAQSQSIDRTALDASTHPRRKSLGLQMVHGAPTNVQ